MIFFTILALQHVPFGTFQVSQITLTEKGMGYTDVASKNCTLVEKIGMLIDQLIHTEDLDIILKKVAVTKRNIQEEKMVMKTTIIFSP